MNAISSNIISGIKELSSYPLRTALSILGVSIGVFCIVSVSTVFDSMETNIQENMSTLGNDVLYVGKFAWMPEEGETEYAWWRYKARPVVTRNELQTIQKEAINVSYSAIMYSYNSPVKYRSNKITSIPIYEASYDFNKLQPIDVKTGRYFSLGEMQEGRSNGVVIGSDLADDLFGNINPVDKEISLGARKFYVLGVIKKTGQMTTGFQFDEGAIISYNYFSTFDRVTDNTNGGFADPMLMLKARSEEKLTDTRYEIEGILRRLRGLKANEKNNFAFNQLDGIQEKVGEVFAQIKYIGWMIGGFSLIVGIFSVANIMFVSVKERTNIIGIKKAIGATNTAVLTEFLIEAIVLCLFGGIVGMLFTFILTKVLTSTFEFPVYIDLVNVFFGIALSIAVGVVSGYIPAYRASKLDPVEAIRS